MIRAKLLCLLTLFACLAIMITPARGFQPQWLTYKGAYFEVKYPASFRVKPIPGSDQTPDSAYFTAPDGSVEFYVFSPIWNGDPDIEINEATETYVAQNTEVKGGIKIRRATIRAKNGSYTRSYEDTENTNTNNRTTFGIKYKNQAAYNKYRQTYLAFKKSLKQYAD